jgi:hypothetical protein
MLRTTIVIAGILLLTACSTTSTVHQSFRAPNGETYGYSFSNQGGDDHEGIALLDRKIESRLRDAGLLGSEGSASKINVVLKHYYMRSNGARFWAGIMAGRDKIISNISVVGADGVQVGNFEVETFNSTAWGTTDGLMEKHATEIVTRLRGA